MLTATNARTGLHESAHAAAAWVLGKIVERVTRQRDGAAEGAVLFRCTDVEDRQVILVMPFVEMEDRTGFDPLGCVDDVRQAKQLGDITRAVARARELRRDPEYRRCLLLIEDALWHRVSLSASDLITLLIPIDRPA